MNEKNILLMTNSSFVIKLFETYNGTQTVYFLLEPALGGELYQTYNKKSLHGSDKHAKYYCSGTLFAFEHLHAGGRLVDPGCADFRANGWQHALRIFEPDADLP